MKRCLVIILLFVFCAGCFSVTCAETDHAEGVVAKVTTRQGTLNMRAKPDRKGRVVEKVPNGTCLMVLEEAQDWCLCLWNGKQGYCKTEFLTFLRDADVGLLDYRVLKKGDRGDDGLMLKARLQELGFIRSGSVLTDTYNGILSERVILFQSQVGMTEDGIASQELQAFVFSEKAPQCTQTLPRVRSRVGTGDSGLNKEICGCCMGEGCGYQGWIFY